jgi:hypothetical protein
VKDSTETDTLYGPIALTLSSQYTYKYNGFWVDFDDPEEECKIILSLDAGAGITLEAGVARAGTPLVLKDPKFGLEQGVFDYSIKKELNSGTRYYKKRDIVDTFNIEINALRDYIFYGLFSEVFKQYGEAPMPWKVSDTSSEYDWAIFAHMGPPTGSHINIDYSTVGFQLTGAV